MRTLVHKLEGYGCDAGMNIQKQVADRIGNPGFKVNIGQLVPEKSPMMMSLFLMKQKQLL